MKNIIIFILATISFSFSRMDGISNKDKPIFKSIKEASFSVKRSGIIKRKTALLNKVNRINYYNKKGELIEYKQFEFDGSIYEKAILTKNEMGKPLKGIINSSDGNLKRYWITKLDKNGNVVEFNNYDSNDKLLSNEKSEFDKNGNEIKKTHTNLEYNYTSNTTYKYNSKNQMIERIHYNGAQNSTDKRTYKYDDKGNEVESVLTRPNGDYTKFVSTYNDQNDILTQYWIDKDGNQKHWNNWEYSYDKYSNWITKKRFSNGELGYIWERKIEYY